MLLLVSYLVVAVIAAGLAGLAVFLYVSIQEDDHPGGCELSNEEDFEREVVLELLLTNFVPAHFKKQIKAYMNKEIDLSQLKEVLAEVVKPGSGFTKYASKQKKEEFDGEEG